MNRMLRRERNKHADTDAIKQIKSKNLRSRRVYTPGRSDFKKAYALYCKDFDDIKIAAQLGITESCYNFYKHRFRMFYKKMGDAAVKIIPLKALPKNKNGLYGGMHRKGQYKLDPNTIDLNLVHDLSLAGYTQARICKMIGVCESTFIKYKKLNPDIQDAIHNAKARADVEVLLALHSVATGYSHKDTHFSSFQGDIFTKEYIKYYPPNVQAAINWLINSPNINWNQVKEANIGTEKGEILEFLDGQHALPDNSKK